MAGREVWSHYCPENCAPNIGMDLVEIERRIPRNTGSQGDIFAERHGA